MLLCHKKMPFSTLFGLDYVLSGAGYDQGSTTKSVAQKDYCAYVLQVVQYV
jgi:hypothetical protein